MSRRAVAALFVVALAVRLAYLAVPAPHLFGLTDGVDYDRYARGILQGAGYPRRPGIDWFFIAERVDASVLIAEQRTGHPFIRPPVFPYYLAAVYAAFGVGNVAAVRLLNAVLDALTVVMLALLAGRLAGATAALTTGALAAVYPHFVVHATYVGTETLFTCLVALLVSLLVRGVSSPGGAGTGVVYGLVVAVATLCRPIFVPIMPPLAVWMLLAGAPTRRERVRITVAAGLTVAVVLGAWGAANWRRSGEWYLFDGGGLMFQLGHNAAYARTLAATTPRENGELEAAFYREVRAGFALTESMGLRERDAHYRREAWRYIVDNPGAAARLELRKLWHFWRPWVNPVIYGPAALIVTGLAFGLATALGLAGLVLAWRTPAARPAVVLFALLIVAGTASALATIVQVRYRVPVVDPYLLVAAGVTVQRLRSRWAEPRNNACRILEGPLL